MLCGLNEENIYLHLYPCNYYLYLCVLCVWIKKLGAPVQPA